MSTDISPYRYIYVIVKDYLIIFGKINLPTQVTRGNMHDQVQGNRDLYLIKQD